MKEKGRWTAVVVYAVAMALVEAAVVTYLRVFLGRVDPISTSRWMSPTG